MWSVRGTRAGHVARCAEEKPMSITSRSVILSSVVALACIMAVAGPLPPAKPNAWSDQVAGLYGRLHFGEMTPAKCADAPPSDRLRVSETRLKTDQYYQITLELANQSPRRLAVECRNPGNLTLTVIDGNGKPVTLMARVVLAGSLPQWGVIPSRTYLGLPVGVLDQGSLDIFTCAWKLPPGKYRIIGRFASGRAANSMDRPVVTPAFSEPDPDLIGKAEVWSGIIELPPLDVEVTDKE